MRKLNNSIQRLNKIWGRKTICMWVFFIFLYFLCFLFEDCGLIEGITNFVASYIPMISGLKSSEVTYAKMGADYFSMIAVSCPFFFFWIIFQD
uniref:hypothetical protein n=2 Tax=Actinomycetes TaxID=1760 RepID=UPI001F349A8E